MYWRWAHPVPRGPMASRGALASRMGMAVLLSDHLGRGVKVLVEELELVGQCPIPNGRIGVEVKVRPWIDPEHPARGSLDQRPGAVDRGLPILLGGAHQQRHLQS